MVVLLLDLVVQVEEIEEMEPVQQVLVIHLQLVHHKEVMEERPPWRRGWEQLVVAEPLAEVRLVVHPVLAGAEEMVEEEQQQIFQLLQRFMVVEVEVRPQVQLHQVQDLEDLVVVEWEMFVELGEPLVLEELILVAVQEEIIPIQPMVLEVAE